MLPTHELIDRDEPRCLYCNGDCDIKQDGLSISTWSPHTNTYEVQILTCRKCQEVFEIHWYDHEGEVTYHAFAFTCKDLLVFYMYPRDTVTEASFAIETRKNLYEKWKDDARKMPRKNRVPPFPVDFSNKEKLWEKLKTYIIFS